MVYDLLYPWQQKIVENFKNKNFGVYLGCGLGKTPIGIGLAEASNSEKVVVVTINGKSKETVEDRGSWFDWAAKSKMNYNLWNKKQTNFNGDDNDFYIINYEGLYKRKGNKLRVELIEGLANFIKSCKNKNVSLIIDESHKMKNLQSLQTQAIFKLYKELVLKSNQCNIYLLSGTPFTSGFIDLYSQLKILGCELSKTQFIDKYCERGNLPGLFGWQQPIVGYKNLDELFELIHNFAITMESKDIVNLPEQVFIHHNYPASTQFKMITSEKLYEEDIYNYCKANKINYEKINKEGKINNPFYRNIDYPSDKYLCETAGNLRLRAKQLSIGFVGNADECIWYDRTRLNMLKKFLQNNEDNYLLFYNYIPELLEIYQICEELGYNIDVYSGDIKSLIHYERYSKLSKSQQLVEKKNIILANWQSGSTGMNWQLYNQCILFSLPSYKDYGQGLKRIHRLGQTSTCVYHVFHQKNWLENRMMKAIEDKKEYNVDMFESDRKLNDCEE